MIQVYTHRGDDNHPVSIHELHKNFLYPASIIDHSKVWRTGQFVQTLKDLPHSREHFEFCNWNKDIPISGQGYYLLHYGCSQHIQDNLGFVVLPPEVRDQINDGTLTLLVVFAFETFDNDVSISKWQSNFCLALSALGITRHNSVKVLLGANSKLMHWHRDPRVTWIYYPWFEAILQSKVRSSYSHIDQVPKYNSSVAKKYKFLSLNLNPRPHRIIMTSMLEFLDVTKYGYISWPSTHDRLLPEDNHLNLFSTGIKQNCNFERFVVSKQRLTGTYHDSTMIDGSWLGSMLLYQQAEFELINETHHQTIGDLVFLTEKTFRALFAGVPFLLFGNPGSLALLQQLGYKTFPTVFDEGYDKIHAPMQSVEFVAGQVQQICTRNHSWADQPEIDDTVNFNQRHFWTKMHAAEIHKAIVHSNG